VIILAVLGVWYFSPFDSNPATGTDTATSSDTTGSTGTPAATTPAAGSTTFRSIFTQTGNHQCDYTQAGTNSQANSVIYIADGKMRGEFRTTANGVSTASLMIYTGGYLYSWKEGATVGTKSSIKTIADLPEVIPSDLTSGAILGTGSNNVGWNCHDWLKDTKIFTLPTYVKFSTR
jgi:hypothetical protein